MLWAQWTLLGMWVGGLAVNLYAAGKKGETEQGITQFLAAVIALVVFFFAGAFDLIF